MQLLFIAIYYNCYCDQLNYCIAEIPLGDIVFHRINIPYLYDVIACIKDIVSKKKKRDNLYYELIFVIVYTIIDIVASFGINFNISLSHVE